MEPRQILIGVIVLILLYLIYKYFKTENDKVLLGQTDARTLNIIPYDDLPSLKTVDYTYSIWFYVNDWNYRYGETKVIYGRADSLTGSSENANPSVTFTPSTNNINVTIATYTGSTSSNSSLHTCSVENVPLQKWTHLLISLNNRSLDIYLDGKLVRTCLLPGVPKVPESTPIYVTPNGGFAGYVSNFRVIGNATNPTEAYNIYKEGYGGSSIGLFDRYKVKMALVKDNNEWKSVQF